MEQESPAVTGPAGICAIDGGSKENEAQGQAMGNYGITKLWGLKYRYIKRDAMSAQPLKI